MVFAFTSALSCLHVLLALVVWHVWTWFLHDSLCRGSMVVSGLPSEEEGVVEEEATEVVVGVDIQGT